MVPFCLKLSFVLVYLTVGEVNSLCIRPGGWSCQFFSENGRAGPILRRIVYFCDCQGRSGAWVVLYFPNPLSLLNCSRLLLSCVCKFDGQCTGMRVAPGLEM